MQGLSAGSFYPPNRFDFVLTDIFYYPRANHDNNSLPVLHALASARRAISPLPHQ